MYGRHTPPPPYHQLHDEPSSSSVSKPNAQTHHQKRHQHDAQEEIHQHCLAIREELHNHGFTDQHKSEIVVALDISASMQNPNQFYFDPHTPGTILEKIRRGKVQSFLRTALSTAVEIAPGEHTVTIFPFGKVAYPPIVIDEHDLEEATEKVLASIMLFREIDANLHLPVQKALTSLMAEDQLNPDLYSPKNKAYLLSLKNQPEINEDELDQAMNNVVTFMCNNLDGNTNYFAATKAILDYYQLPSKQPAQALYYPKPPIYVFFPTDGEANMSQYEALNLFEIAAHFPIFFHFIGLQGENDKLTFKQLSQICESNWYLPNRNLTKLKDPTQLTIQQIFRGVRHWLWEAHEHKVLKHNPGVILDLNNPDDHQEIRAAQSSAQQHGHAASSSSIVYKPAPAHAYVPGGLNPPPPAFNPTASNSSLAQGHFGTQNREHANLQRQAQNNNQSEDDCGPCCTIM